MGSGSFGRSIVGQGMTQAIAVKVPLVKRLKALSTLG